LAVKELRVAISAVSIHPYEVPRSRSREIGHVRFQRGPSGRPFAEPEADIRAARAIKKIFVASRMKNG
jgi:hypothetical protein